MSDKPRQFVIWQNGKGQWHVAERTPEGTVSESVHISETRAFRNIISRTPGVKMLYITEAGEESSWDAYNEAVKHAAT